MPRHFLEVVCLHEDQNGTSSNRGDDVEQRGYMGSRL